MQKGRLGASVVLSCLACFGVLGATWAANWRPKLGLDLAGGLSVVYQPQGGQKVSSGILQTAATIMTDRALAQGLSQPIINVQGNTIQVQIPGVTNRQKALDVIGNTAQLFFRPVLCEAPAYLPPTPAKGKPAPATKYVPQDAKFTCSNSQYLFTSAGFDPATQNYNPPAAGADPTLAQYQTSTPSQDSTKNGAYPVLLDATSTPYGQRLLLGPAMATGTIVKTASAVLDNTGQWVISVSLTGPGTAAFNSIAQKLYHNLLANDLGGTLQSAPVLLSNNYDTGVSINGGNGGFTQDQATQLAQVLQYGTLPVPFQILDQSFVSATLGHSSLVAGLAAGLLGLLLVMIYMVFYYRALGLVVIFGLLTTGALIFGLISLLGATENLTLDLSGVTGLVVSVGITVDSYVVYFERLKDEIRSGRSVRASVDRGFRRAFRTVVAADAVSFLGAACLWLLSIGAVKGFAYWLGVSTLIDVASAYFFTRPAVILMGRSRIATDTKVIGIARGLAAAPEGAA